MKKEHLKTYKEAYPLQKIIEMKCHTKFSKKKSINEGAIR